MTKSLLAVAILLTFAVIAFATASSGATTGDTTIPTSAWTAVHTPSDSNIGVLGNSGQTFTGDTGSQYAYVLGSTWSLELGKTSFCVYNALHDQDKCDVNMLLLDGNTWSGGRFINVGIDTLVFTVLNTADGTSKTYRWSAAFGIEWTLDRGVLASGGFTEIDDPLNAQQILVVPSATDGSSETIVAVATIGHTMDYVWKHTSTIPAALRHPMRTYARDFTYVSDGQRGVAVAYISAGSVFSLSLLNGTVLVQIDKPCGFNFTTDARMIEAKVQSSSSGSTVFTLIVYGNDGTDGNLKFCALDANNLAHGQPLWNVTNIVAGQGDATVMTTAPDCIVQHDGDVAVLRTDFDRFGIPWPVWSLFVIATDPHAAARGLSQARLISIDAELGGVRWILIRDAVKDKYNLPTRVFESDQQHSHVAVSINGTMTGIDPVDSNVKWTCGSSVGGCRSSAAVLRNPTSGALSRAACVSSSDPASVIAFDIDSAQQCLLAWKQSVPSGVVDVDRQKQPGILTVLSFPIEPFITVPTTTGSIITMALRASNESAPTAVPPPPPPPTLPPQKIPPPAVSITTAPPLFLKDITQHSGAQIEPFIAEGPVVVSVAQATLVPFMKSSGSNSKKTSHHSDLIKNEKNEDGQEVGLGNVVTIFYFQSFFLQQTTSDVVVGQVVFPFDYFLSTPLVVYKSSSTANNGQFVAAVTQLNGNDFDLVLLFTSFGGGVISPAPASQSFSRCGATTVFATDGNGRVFFTSGFCKGAETLSAVLQAGSGSVTQTLWIHEFEPLPQAKNMSVHTSDVVYVTSAAVSYGVVAVAYHTAFKVFNADNAFKQLDMEAPCGFDPAPSSGGNVEPMQIFSASNKTTTLLLVAVNTGNSNVGVCAVVADPNWNTHHSFTISGASYGFISGAAGIGDVFLVGYYSQGVESSIGHISARDFSTGAEIWHMERYKAPGFTFAIMPSSGNSLFVTNVDDAMTPDPGYSLQLIRTIDGVSLAACDFACSRFSAFTDSSGVDVIACSVAGFEEVLRLVHFIDSNSKGTKKCVVRWETDTGATVKSISESVWTSGSTGARMISVTTATGFIGSYSLDKYVAPTFAPIPTGGNVETPKYVEVTDLISQWYDPVTIANPTSAPTQNYGGVNFVAVDTVSTLRKKSSSSGSSNDKQQQQQATLGAETRKTALIAYSTAPALKYDQVFVTLDPFVTVVSPVIFTSTTERTAAFYSFPSELIVLSYPVVNLALPRFGGFSLPAFDSATSTIFYSIGAQNNEEQFAAAQLNTAGETLTSLWKTKLPAPSGNIFINLTSHIGNPLFVNAATAGDKRIFFSFAGELVVLSAADGTKQTTTQAHPCGCGSPPVIDEFGAAWDMSFYQIIPQPQQLSSSSIIALVNNGNAAGSQVGTWCVCNLDAAAGATTNYQFQVKQIDEINGVWTFPGSSAFALDFVSAQQGGGMLNGYSVTDGSSIWTVTRRHATGFAVQSSTDANSVYCNWDSAGAAVLALVSLQSGTATATCDNFACSDTPFLGGDGKTVVCAWAENPLLLRAFTITQADGCKVVWEAMMPNYVNSVSSGGAKSVLVGLANGATANVSLASGAVTTTTTTTTTAATPSPSSSSTMPPEPTNTLTTITPPPPPPTSSPPTPPSTSTTTPSPSGSNNNHNGGNQGNATNGGDDDNGGLGGGEVAGIVIAVLVVFVGAAVVVYAVMRSRNSRRAAMAYHESGIQGGSSAGLGSEVRVSYGATELQHSP